LFGEDGVLDSLELVNLIVAFEQRIQSDLDLAITLADEKAMSQKRNPFRSIEALADYAIRLLKEEQGL
jgi:acyl carrier protein